MKTIYANDVNEAFPIGMLSMSGLNTTHKNSRNGPVIEYNEPVATVYHNPTQRVLFDKTRDCNPFFHFMEGLWMLDGKNSVAWISEYSSKISDYSDDGITFHGGYGARLRKYRTPGSIYAVDQLKTIAIMLRRDPTDRRAVANIWEAGLDLDTVSKDIPCNDIIFFKVRNDKLDMTVCCRSNDAIWGCYGANAVHFSMIQEWVASMTGYPVGRYTQISDSLHVYTENPQWEKLKNIYYSTNEFHPYESMKIEPYPMFQENTPIESWDSDLRVFMMLEAESDTVDVFRHRFFSDVAMPMKRVWRMYKQGGDYRFEALKLCKTIIADDWRIACQDWIIRRLSK